MGTSEPRIALQLYTVRDALSQDYEGTLRRVKDIGYNAVQLAGKMPCDGGGMNKMLQQAGLEPIGIHLGIEDLENELDHWLGFVSTIGSEDLICSYLPEERRKAKEDWLAVASLFELVGATCREKGVSFSYHNHSFEFASFDGQYGLDLLFEHTTAGNVLAELDTYWVQHGGESPSDYIRKYSGRIRLLHVKDMADDEDRSFAEVGSGILDWPDIHRAAIEAGVAWFCVEQDVCKRDPLESAAMSLEFLTGLLGT